VRTGQCRHRPLPDHVAVIQRLENALVKLVVLQPWDRSLCRKMILIFSCNLIFLFVYHKVTDALWTSFLMALADHAMVPMMVGIQDEMCRTSSAMQS
jgi:hypothetical protein